MIQESPMKSISCKNNHPTPNYEYFKSQISRILTNQKHIYASEWAYNMSKPVLRGIASNCFPVPSINFIKKAGSSSNLQVPTICYSVPKIDITSINFEEEVEDGTKTTTTTTSTSTCNIKLKKKRRLKLNPYLSTKLYKKKQKKFAKKKKIK